MIDHFLPERPTSELGDTVPGKLGCVVKMVADSIVPNAEFGRNDHPEDALSFILWIRKTSSEFLINSWKRQ